MLNREAIEAMRQQLKSGVQIAVADQLYPNRTFTNTYRGVK